jgi:hypothetical protein
MATRIPMIEALCGHARPEVAEWARANVQTFSGLVEKERRYEAKEDQNRDERFE